MCGILCLISDPKKPTNLQKLYDSCKAQIEHRGPNSQKTIIFNTTSKKLQLSASVLWLQGEQLVHQPIETSKSLFAYNGDVFGGSVVSEINCSLHGDTKLLQELLESSKSPSKHLENVYGPYSFIYYDKLNVMLHFGRDIFGRRSLLIAADQANNALLLSSVAVRTKVSVMEVPAIGIFSLDVGSNNYILNTWPVRNKNFEQKVESISSFLAHNISINSPLEIKTNEFVMPQEYDLNVIEHIKSLTHVEGFEYLLKNDKWRANVLQLNNKLESALKRRLESQPKYCQNCLFEQLHCNHCRVGVLFSGGVDCTILALIADKFINKDLPIDLMNVAFEKAENYETPDRLTGLQSLLELQSLRPDRNWNFLPINVTTQELDAERSRQIADLIFPLNSILDDSLGCALWFASRGQTDLYTSPCRVLIVGMGADELFGGYTRHRAAFKNKSWLGLHEVLEDDWANIAHRNLARDDRVVADHGRQLRIPYLDEEVVGFVRSLRVWEKTCPAADLAQGFGEKILLRTLAYYLGLRHVAGYKKRALQFGSRIADKKENAHEVSPRLVH